MTTLFDLDFANESVGAYLQNIDSNWSRKNSVNFAVTAGHRLATYQYSGATYSYTQDGVIHWELDVYADDVSTAGPAWYIGVGTNGSDATTGAYVQYRFADNLWRIYEGYTVIGSVSDDWWSQGNTRRLILDWDPTAGALTLTVMDGATTVGSSTVNGVTPDGNNLLLAAMWNDVSYTTITLSGMLATDGASSGPVNFDEALSVSGGGSASLTDRLGYLAALSATGGGAAELAAQVGFLDSLSASGGGEAALADLLGFQVGLATSGGGSASLTARIGIKDVLSISGGGAAELTAVVGFFEALAVSGGGSATLYIEGDTAVIREVIRLAGDRRLNFQLAGDRRLVITLTGNIGD